MSREYENIIGKTVKEERRKAGLTQEAFALRSGLGLRFIRELEQGKETVRLDKVNQALRMFGMELIPKRMEKKWVELCDTSYLSENEKDAMKQLIKERIARIS